MKKIHMLLVALLLLGCGGEERPEGILTERQMIPILIDIYAAEGKISTFSLKRDSSINLFEEVEEAIFQKYDVTDSAYRKSLTYYYENPKEIELIYEVVLDSLKLREGRMEEAEKKKREETQGKKESQIEEDGSKEKKEENKEKEE